MSEVGKWLHLENRWELLQEKHTHMKLLFLERGIPTDLSVIKFFKILHFRLQQKFSQKIRSFYLKFTPTKFECTIFNLVSLERQILLFKTVYHLIWKQVLVRVPMQQKLETP